MFKGKTKMHGICGICGAVTNHYPKRKPKHKCAIGITKSSTLARADLIEHINKEHDNARA